MARRTLLDRRKLIERLPPAEYKEPAETERDEMANASLAASLLALVDTTPEREFALCRRSAEHLLEQVPEPLDYGEDDEEEG